MHSESSDPEEKLDSLFHKAGSFSIYAIVASFVLQFVYSRIWMRVSPDAARLLGLIPTVAMISAIPAGVIALCGIPHYGRKKLLWKGLVGMICPIVLFVFSVYFSAYLRARIIEETQKMEQKK
ncbi:hypothetical protein DB347_25220 [Opitutaceae bacterium EW11]|nr:hypothetical protein DB347_25220 [Opitutaceae bacterium EW11]